MSRVVDGCPKIDPDPRRGPKQPCAGTLADELETARRSTLFLCRCRSASMRSSVRVARGEGVVRPRLPIVLNAGGRGGYAMRKSMKSWTSVAGDVAKRPAGSAVASTA
jgi:hypothetical protein